ncbi:hypoxia up-regulated protein 1 [Parasteatoda tepidariorum]|uniref:hypoxia up-regulated protein 1 n=1 Tax=Parasteatoda tepidariorum TaxID=114398 RepID=UPI00077F85CE|nr:hypoxia up-regulated protein 1 [Parasteatoda tepidariorum]XP_042899814.1 hypoxia up-regulated protein 1 [Parasteatoda tepidariorum]
MKLSYIFFFTFIHIFSNNVHGLAVMSVDIGSEWMKVAIVSPGVPMEIALNRESQRKTPVIVSFRDGERVFGDPALTIGVRFPDKAFMYLMEVIGKTVDNPLVELYKTRFPYYDIKASEDRKSVIFVHPDGMEFSVEELIAMVLKQAQDIAQKAAGQPIKDAVITVPPFFSQAERRAMLQAAKLSGINVLQLINSNTAVALNYGVFRRRDFNETPTNIMFYDMGAGNTVATVATYQLVKSKETGEVSPQLTVKGVGFDQTLGGLEMQLRLRDYLAKEFNKQKKTQTDVFQNKRAMAKLFKEAGRVKKVLSANTEHIAQVESLLDDKDFKLPITRVDFETLCSDLFERVTKPAEAALKSANMDLVHVDQVILSGSGARVPKVQQQLTEYIQKEDLGKSLNTDESAALGAAYQAAHLSKGFKVKSFLIKDANLYPIQVDFQREYELEDKTTGVKTVKRILFNRNNPIPVKKIMTFNRHVKDFEFYVNYGELNFLTDFELKSLGSLNISKVSLKGVENAISKHMTEKTEYKGVKAHFKMDESGILYLEEVESVFEKTEEESPESKLESAFNKLGSTLGRLFSGGSTDETEEEPKKQTEETKAEETTNKTKEANETEQSQNINKEKEKNATESKSEVKIVILKEPVESSEQHLDLPPLVKESIKKSVGKLKDLDDHDRARFAKAKAKNSLESFIVETRDKLYRDEYEKASTEEERNNIQQSLSQASDWLEYESDDADTSVFKSKLEDLKKLTKDLFERIKEHHDRPEALKAFNEMLNISKVFLGSARNMTEEQQIFTEVEMKTLESLIDETEKWGKENVAEQNALPLSQTPKLTVKQIGEKVANLDREVKYLLNKARFAQPLKKKETKNKTESEKIIEDTVNATSENENSTKSVEEDTPVLSDPDAAEATVEDSGVVMEEDTITPSPTTTKPSGLKDDEHSEL